MAAEKTPVWGGYRCPCFAQKDTAPGGWDCIIQVGETPLAPGERRRLAFAFLSGQKAAAIMKGVPMFYLWEGKFIGEAVTVTDVAN